MRLAAALLLAVLLLSPSTASAQLWNDEWRSFGRVDGLVVAGFAGLVLTTEMYGGPRQPRWNHEVLLDLPLRRVLGSKRTPGEHRAALLSDVMVTSLIAAPFIDAAATYQVHDDGTFSTQVALYSLQSFALTFGATNLVKVLVGRARPIVARCFQKEPSDTTICEPRPNVSFFSGHSSAAFTGAGLMCAFGNLAPDRYGGGIPARLPCIGGLTLAATTAVLRLVANKHHLTDVLVGTTMGLLSGWLLPTLRIR